jgi:hypothetical protein
MKRILLFFVCCIAPSFSFSAFTQNMVWEVEPVSGNDNNGCGWDAGSAGVDKSTWSAVSLSGLTSAGAGSTILNSAAVVSDAGNIVNITGGTNFNLGRFRITSVAAGISWTTDHAVTTGVGVSGMGFVYGACKSLSPLTTSYVSGNSIYVKNESTLVLTSSISFNVGTNAAVGTPWVRLIGYNTTRGDLGQAHFQMSTTTVPSPAIGLSINGVIGGVSFENIWMDCNGVSTSTGIFVNSTPEDGYFLNIKVSSCTSNAFSSISGNLLILDSEFTTNSGAAVFYSTLNGIPQYFYNNWFHDNSTLVVYSPSNAGSLNFIGNIFSNNTGATSDCIRTGWGDYLFNNSFYKCGRDGFFSNSGNGGLNTIVLNNIFDQNGRYGVNMANAAGFKAQPFYDGNSYYSNATAARNNMDDISTNKINGVGAYTNISDITLSSDPFINPGSNDFRLNNAIGGGGAILYKGVPKTAPTITPISYPSMGYYAPPPLPKASATQ